MALATPQPDAVPSLDAGVNLLEVPNPRTTALHQDAPKHLQAHRGTDARTRPAK